MDEAALIDALLRLAMTYVPSRAAAEEVVQEAWIAVLRGLDGFERRSSLKTWVFRILTNIAMRGGGRERRSVPFSAVEPEGPSVDPGRFLPEDHERWPGHWALPPSQRVVLALRDIGGWRAEEVADALERYFDSVTPSAPTDTEGVK